MACHLCYKYFSSTKTQIDIGYFLFQIASKFVNPATARQNHRQQEVEQSQVDTFAMDEGSK